MRESIPLACSLTAGDQADRRLEFGAILRRGLLAREDTPRGIRLRFRTSPGLQQDLVDLTNREKECCSFFDFRIESFQGEIVLEVGAPPEARPIVEELFASEGR
jgi:MerR family copper efflux transcriptional regulator